MTPKPKAKAVKRDCYCPKCCLARLEEHRKKMLASPDEGTRLYNEYCLSNVNSPCSK